MALKRMTTIELISDRDDAVESIHPLVIKKGQDPFVFVFKNPTNLDVRDAYLLKMGKLQKNLAPNKDKLEKFDLDPDEYVKVVNDAATIQFEIIDLLMIGYKTKIDGELLKKDDEILQIMKDNDVINEFYSKLAIKENNSNKKKY